MTHAKVWSWVLLQNAKTKVFSVALRDKVKNLEKVNVVFYQELYSTFTQIRIEINAFKGMCLHCITSQLTRNDKSTILRRLKQGLLLSGDDN